MQRLWSAVEYVRVSVCSVHLEKDVTRHEDLPAAIACLHKPTMPTVHHSQGTNRGVVRLALREEVNGNIEGVVTSFL